jgi:hypothetical protein
MAQRAFFRRVPTAVLLAAAACSTTSFVSTWSAPEAQPLRLAGSKVAAVFMTRNSVARRNGEDAMAREITARGAQGVASYTVLSDDDVRNEEQARTTFEKLGFQGTVAMRVVGRETQYTYTPSYWGAYPYYGRFWGGYWGWGWGTVYQPGYLTADKIVSVETLVYSLRQDKLVWAGVSQTVDPTEINSFVSELAKAVTSKMKEAGLL